MLSAILPAGVVVVQTFADQPDVELFPEEQAVIAKAVDKRRHEFATVRHCARLALGQLGLPPVALVPTERGAPSWPAGVVGSMTHCSGYRAAAVARIADIRTVGIDAEPHEPLPTGVLGLVSLPAERERMHDLAQSYPEVHWDRLLFSAKESVYKAWFPLTRAWLDFSEAELTFDPATSSFVASILRKADTVDGQELSTLAGRWTVSRGLVATAIAPPR